MSNTRKTEGCRRPKHRLKIARGQYIAYLDDDDLFYPNHVETLVRALESANTRLPTRTPTALTRKRKTASTSSRSAMSYSVEFDYDKILTTNFVPCSASCMIVHASRRRVVRRVAQRLEDWDMWIRMSRKFKFVHVKELTCEFSWRTDGTT